MMLLPVDSRYSIQNFQSSVKFVRPGFVPKVVGSYMSNNWLPVPASSGLPQFPSLPHSILTPTTFFPPPSQIPQPPVKPQFQETRSDSIKSKIFRPWLEETVIEEKEVTEKCVDKSVASNSRSISEAPLKNYVPNTSDPHLEEHSALEMIATNLGKSTGGHRCIYCAKIYSRKYGLKIHLRTHTGFKPLQCRICGRAFGDPSNLNKHTRLHTENGQPFKCNLCDKLLVRKRDLERHLLSRHSISS